MRDHARPIGTLASPPWRSHRPGSAGAVFFSRRPHDALGVGHGELDFLEDVLRTLRIGAGPRDTPTEASPLAGRLGAVAHEKLPPVDFSPVSALFVALPSGKRGMLLCRHVGAENTVGAAVINPAGSR